VGWLAGSGVRSLSRLHPPMLRRHTVCGAGAMRFDGEVMRSFRRKKVRTPQLSQGESLPIFREQRRVRVPCRTTHDARIDRAQSWRLPGAQRGEMPSTCADPMGGRRRRVRTQREWISTRSTFLHTPPYTRRDTWGATSGGGTASGCGPGGLPCATRRKNSLKGVQPRPTRPPRGNGRQGASPSRG
jgi:hypothetical protein